MNFLTSLIVVLGLLSAGLAKPTFDVIADIIHDLVHDPNHPPGHRDPLYNEAQQPYGQINAYNRPYIPQSTYPYYPPYAQGPHPQTISHHTLGNQQYAPNVYATNGYRPPSNVYDRQGYYQGPPHRQYSNGYPQTNNGGYQSPPQHIYKHPGY